MRACEFVSLDRSSVLLQRCVFCIRFRWVHLYVWHPWLGIYSPFVLGSGGLGSGCGRVAGCVPRALVVRRCWRGVAWRSWLFGVSCVGPQSRAWAFTDGYVGREEVAVAHARPHISYWLSQFLVHAELVPSIISSQFTANCAALSIVFGLLQKTTK